MTVQQSSRLLAELFARFDEEQRITVLHLGPALPETVAFFSAYRCKLHFVDLFEELPLRQEDPEGPTVAQRLEDLLQFPPDTRFDLCLFWDLLNHLDAEAITLLQQALQPWLAPGCLGHGFAVHSPRTTPQRNEVFAIDSPEILAVRSRPVPAPAYAPFPQSRLQELLKPFRFERTMLLADSRLELLLTLD